MAPTSPDVIIIGAGPSGIAMAYALKHKYGFEDFTVSIPSFSYSGENTLTSWNVPQIYEKLDGVGGTWRTNTYPGVGCDIPTILYSFHFNLNPNWSKELCEGPEILDCAYHCIIYHHDNLPDTNFRYGRHS